MTDRSSIRTEILRLAPWHLDVEVAEGLRTSLFVHEPERPGTASIEVRVLDPQTGAESRHESFVPQARASESRPHVRLVDSRPDFLDTLRSVYPGGLEGRSVLDCGCNAGAYLFWAKEAGAGRCFGFDVRDHWIEQANFLSSLKPDDAADMEFALSDLYELPGLGLEPFDVVLFNGLFYHLPDPIAGLRIAAEHATELLIVDTVARRATGPDAALAVTEQPRHHISSGVYGLRWLPFGPPALLRLLRWLGFAEAMCTWWRPRGPLRDRIEVVAGRHEGTLEALDAARGQREQRVCAVVETAVPPNTDVLVASAGNEALLAFRQRRGWHFPQRRDGSYEPETPADPRPLDHLEALAAAGADYLVVPLSVSSSLEARPEVLDRLRERYPVIHREPGTCVVFHLRDPERPRFDPRAVRYDSS